VIRLAHGIRELVPGAHMRPLLSALLTQGLPAALIVYGYVLIPVTNRRAVRTIINATQPGDALVGYSNGAWAAVQAAELGAPARALHLVSPALHARHAFPEHLERVYVYHSSGDRAVRLGRAWRRLTRFLPWRWATPHGWGAMGRTGYRGADPRVINVDLGRDVGHSWFNHEAAVQQIARHIHEDFRNSGAGSIPGAGAG
jgi:hypothetical protein